MHDKKQAVEAWMFKSNGASFVMPKNRLQRIVEEPRTVRVPFASQRYNSVVLLEGEFYPIAELFLNDSVALPEANDSISVGIIVAYRNSDNTVSYGAIRADSIPERIMIADEMRGMMDDLAVDVQAISLAAISIADKNHALLAIDRLFAGI